MTEILMEGHRHRVAAVRSITKAARQLARAGNLNGAEAALTLAKTITEDMLDRVRLSKSAAEAANCETCSEPAR